VRVYSVPRHPRNFRDDDGAGFYLQERDLPITYAKHERIALEKHPDYSEKWVQALIAEDPSIIGLGDVDLLAQERIQPRAGRLDLLLRDVEANRRYEVELQLGATDESHIIRTVEYWDIERKRYPQYEHCAVLIAEDITSRFLNVISLFNGTLPFIAIQMQAIKMGDNVTLVFTKVMDELRRGVVDEDEEAISVPSDRPNWVKRASEETVTLAEDILQIAKTLDPKLALKYNKNYIGLTRDGRAYNFIELVPRKNNIIVNVSLPKTPEYDGKVGEADFEQLTYSLTWNQYRLRLAKSDVKEKPAALKEILKLAYDLRSK
jgi:predicted transport protein